MNLLQLISSIFEPLTKLIDSVHTSEAEKLTAKTQLMVLQSQAVSTALDHETKALEARRDIIVAEAKGESWLTSNWRPCIMVACMTATLAYWFGLTPTDPVTGLSLLPLSVVNSMFDLVTIGVGGYIAGRSVEKTAASVVEALKKKDST